MGQEMSAIDEEALGEVQNSEVIRAAPTMEETLQEKLRRICSRNPDKDIEQYAPGVSGTTGSTTETLPESIQIEEKAWRRLKENRSWTSGCDYMHRRR